VPIVAKAEVSAKNGRARDLFLRMIPEFESGTPPLDFNQRMPSADGILNNYSRNKEE